jgi:hypothetical protein
MIGKLELECLLVNRLQKTAPELLVNLQRSSNDLVSLITHPIRDLRNLRILNLFFCR